MPAYTNLRTFVNALKTGKTHITTCLDNYFANPGTVRQNDYWSDFRDGSWSATLPGWLETFLLGPADGGVIGLTREERDHVLAWPKAELERTRRAVVAAVNANQAIKFFWGVYDGPAPQAVSRAGPNDEPQVLFQSPGASLRLTHINYGEVYVEEV